MLFTDIRLQNYRSYIDESFELDGGVNIVVGPNAVGKTNLLEALMLCSVGKSYRAGDVSLINTNSQWARLDVHTTTNQLRTVKLVIDNNKSTKTFELDGKSYKKMSIKTKQPVVLFEPTDLNLINNEPSTRRDYLDNFIDQFIHGHGASVSKMKRILAQRNNLLKQPNLNKTHLFTWDIRLCEISEIIIKNRLVLITQINKNISEIYSSIAGSKSTVKIEYITKLNPLNYSGSLMQALEDNLTYDATRGFTSHGPHRDDFFPTINGASLAESASRGENRTFMLALKIIELKILEDHTNTRPLLLLDDVFSELDGSRRRSLTSYLNKYQTIITTTDADAVMKDFAKNTNKITI